MLDKLVDLLIQFADRALPAVIVKQYQEAVHFRFGRLHRTLGPGLHWKIPFADDVDAYPVVTTTLPLPAQSVTTRDGVSVVVKAHVKYAVTDVSVYGVSVYDAVAALSDVTSGIIHDCIRDMDWEESRRSDLSAVVTPRATAEAARWGIALDRVTVTDYAQMRSIRLFNESGARSPVDVEAGG